MVVSKILKLVNSFTKKDIVLDKELKHMYGSLKIYKCPVNIVYLIQDRVYLGKGYIRGEKYELERNLAKPYSVNNVIFKYRPRLICTLENKEIGTFAQLLKHERQIFGNVKITKSYKYWLKNEIPYQESKCNEEKYHQYEFDGAIYYKGKDGVWVTLSFDNHYDFDEFQDYYINDTLENVQKDFGNWGTYDGETTLTSKDLDFRTIKI